MSNGLFLSLGPELSAGLFHTTNHLVAAVGGELVPP
jgi:hypothetical protein